jgi:hypothetical protein
MFNLIMRSFDWDTGRGSMPLGRLFEYTDDHIAAQFWQDANLLLDRLTALLCLLMSEGTQSEVAHAGQINRARIAGKEISFEFSIDGEVPPFANGMLYANRLALDMRNDFEFSRNRTIGP